MKDWVLDLELGQEQIVRVKGDVDFLNSAEFSSVLARAIEKGPKVVVDLSQAEMLDSSALMALSDAVEQAQRSKVKISLFGVSDRIHRELQITGLASSFGLAMVKSERNKPRKAAPDTRREGWRITESVVLAEPEMIFHLRNLGVAAAREAGLNKDDVADVKLALTEALAHALKYPSSSKSGGNKICLRCMCCSKAFVMEISYGEKCYEPDCITAIGFKLIKSLMDEINTYSDNQKNHIRLLKWIQ